MNPTGPKQPVPVPVPVKDRSCDSEECVAALGEVVRTRNVVVFKCGQVASARARTNVMAAVAAALLTASIAAFAAAAAANGVVIFGFVLSAILLVLAVSLLATAILFFVFAAIGFAQIAVLESELNKARVDFTAATEMVKNVCPTGCWGDVTPPSCVG